MSMKLRVLSLGLLAVLATSAFAVVNASAEQSGHFTAEKDHVIITGTESNPGNHNLKFQRTTPQGEATGLPIECTHVKYHGTAQLPKVGEPNELTTQSITVTPTYEKCATQGGEWGEVTVHHPATPECETKVFKFTSSISSKKATVHVECAITVTHPNCTIKIPKQTLSGVTYTTATDAASGKHELTVDVTVRSITGHFEGGICIFLGTTHTFDMDGSVTVWGEDTEGKRQHITAT